MSFKIAVLMKKHNEAHVREDNEILAFYEENPDCQEIVKLVYGDPVYWLIP